MLQIMIVEAVLAQIYHDCYGIRFYRLFKDMPQLTVVVVPCKLVLRYFCLLGFI